MSALRVHKGRSVGPSCWIASGQPKLKAHRLLHQLQKIPLGLAGQGYCAILIGQIARVKEFVAPPGQVQKTDHVVVLDQGAADIIHLPSRVFTVGVRQETDRRDEPLPWRNIEQSARWIAPNGMKFRLDKHPGALPQSPSDYHRTTLLGDALFHDWETFVDWLADDGLARHLDGNCPGGNLGAQGKHMTGVNLSGNHPSPPGDRIKQAQDTTQGAAA